MDGCWKMMMPRTIWGRGMSNCFRGALLEGNRRFWHNYTPPDNSWTSAGMECFLGQLGIMRVFTPSAHLHLFPVLRAWPPGGVSFGKVDFSWRAEFCTCCCWLLLMTNVSFSASFSIYSPFRQKNNNHVIGHNYDNYSINTIIAATNPKLTVCDKEKIMEYAHCWFNSILTYTSFFFFLSFAFKWLEKILVWRLAEVTVLTVWNICNLNGESNS